MERLVQFRDNQELQGQDLNNIEEFARQSFDHIVNDAINGTKAFAGFTVTQRSSVEVNIDPGRLYSNGEVYSRDDTVVKDLLASLPLAVKRIVAVVVYGREQESDVQPRDYLINADTGQTEPQAVAMERRRFSEVNTVAGVESADPQPPILDATTLPVCYITLGTTGILSIQMLNQYGLPNLTNVNGRVVGLENWRQITEPRITTIGTDIAGLALSLKGLADLKLVTQIAQDVANLKDLQNIDDEAKNYASDNFLTAGESDEAFTGYDAQVQEGIRFNWAAVSDTQLDVFNPYDAGVKVHSDGLVLPAYDSAPRLILNQFAGELGISQYQFQTQSMILKTMTRQRLRWGPTFQVCTNSAFWQSGVLGYKRVEKSPGQFYTIATLTKDGEVFEIEDPDIALVTDHYWARVHKIWYDGVEEPYWDKVITNINVSGSQIAQTFLNSQDGWMTQIGLNFTKLAADGAVNITIVECYHGSPDLEQALMHITVPRSDLKLHPVQTLITIPPTFLKAGGRYAVLVTTGGNHFIATVSGADYAQGTLFYSTDGAYFQADLTRDLMLQLNFARFRRAFVVTELKPLQLAGGITAVDLLHEGYKPASCELRYEVQVNGIWNSIDQYSAESLNNYPAILPLRAVFVGTTDVHPGLRLNGSRARVGRPKTTFRHYSKARTLGQSSVRVVVTSRLEWFQAGAHTFAHFLRVGATDVAPATVVDTVLDVDNGYLQRESTFNIAASTTYRVGHTGTTNGANNTFHVAQRFDMAY